MLDTIITYQQMPVDTYPHYSFPSKTQEGWQTGTAEVFQGNQRLILTLSLLDYCCWIVVWFVLVFCLVESIGNPAGIGQGTGFGLRERDGIGLGHYRLRATYCFFEGLAATYEWSVYDCM